MSKIFISSLDFCKYMLDENKLISFIRMKGLVLPAHIASELKADMIIAGAVLSDMSSSGKIKISNTKIGGSPVYYLPEDAYKLQELYKYLNEKDKRAYDLLKQKKILRDIKLTPLLRVSLRNIKDFAKPLKVNVNSAEEIFWRWFMISSSEAESLVRQFFEPQKVSEKPIENAVNGSTKETTQKQVEKKELSRQEKKPKQILEEKTKQVQLDNTKKIDKKQDNDIIEEQSVLLEEPDDIFHGICKKFFKDKGIIVLDISIVRKNSEIDYILSIPSAIGQIKYYCKAKKKKKSNDSDLAQAFVKGQVKKLPVLYLITGELTKKAKEMLSSEFENLNVKII